MSKFVLDETDCFDSAVRNLNDLIDVICEIQFNTSPEGVDRRVDSLLWIARDMSECIVEKVAEDGKAKKAKGARA